MNSLWRDEPIKPLQEIFERFFDLIGGKSKCNTKCFQRKTYIVPVPGADQ